uniref:uncharacterized protein LOC120346963 n=1 Tax=Styela clava TaxID=7725 RepID=UPI001939EB2A|nr:uncharacterized protein LOC120346963 [Styela clava]
MGNSSLICWSYDPNLSNNVLNLVEQRNTELDTLAAKTEQLEEFAHEFATCTQKVRLKQQARVRCCGIGSKWKVCWYICACQRKIKRQKGKQQKNGKAISTTEELLEDYDYYRPANPGSSGTKPENELASQYTDEETRMKAAELLQLDT